MKILAIRIKNLASLDGITEINFTEDPLSSAGIFAITGPTGAGKSTILDALCLALYAKTPRYRFAENGIDIKDVQGTTIKQDDVRGILRDGTADGYAEVDFAGVDGQYYRATWSVRRARNKAEGNLQAYEMALKTISTNQDIPGRKTELLEEIERLVGLNFEQFTRSVLLAQGDFTAFLIAGKDEKSSLLEKLTGTHIYSEISKRIFENHREQQQKLRELNVQREGITTLTSEELNVLQEQKATLEIALKSYEKQIANLNKETEWHEQWTKLQSGVTSAQLQHEQANNNKTESLLREKQLQQIVRIQPVKSVINNLQNTEEQLAIKSKQSEELISGLSTLQQQKEAIDFTIEQATADLNTKTQEQENAQPLLNAAKALDVQLSEKAEQIKQASEEVEASVNKQKQKAEQLAKTQKEFDLLEQDIIKLNQWKTENEIRRPTAEQETIILSKLGDAESILENVNTYTSRIGTTEKEIESHQHEKQRLDSESIPLQALLQQIQNEYGVLQETLSNIPIHDMEKEKSAIDISIEDIISAEGHWKILHNAINQQNELQQSLENNKKELEQHTEKLATADRLLETIKLEKDASLKMLEKAKSWLPLKMLETFAISLSQMNLAPFVEVQPIHMQPKIRSLTMYLPNWKQVINKPKRIIHNILAYTVT